MQIVIDIPYKDFEKLATFGQFNPFDLSLAIEKGIVLPKGHGRLIDADALMVYCRNQRSRTIDCNDIARFPTTVPRVIAENEE